MLRSLETTLESNHYTLSPSLLGALEPSQPTHPVGELREQYQAQGYLWLQGLLPRAEVEAFRRYFFRAFEDTGLLAPHSDPVEGRWSGQAEDRKMAAKRLMEVVRSAAYESFCLHPRLWQFLEGFLGGPAYLHKRKIIRYTKPGDQSATGAHYDLVYLRGGTDRFCTVWIPIGDCPIEMGGLVYLEGSHAKGQALEAQFTEQNQQLPPEERLKAFNKNMGENGWISKDLPTLAAKFGSRWLAADYQAGDIMLHSPYMIHAATTNQDALGRLRLSTDIRYQNVRDEIDARWSNHWTLEDML
jgi:ectoine hydroxylase-related dioxygenase (phytanoyl-CoA dioxygenase family)